VFNWISVVFGLMCVFFLWSSIRTLSLGFFLSEGKMGPLLREKILAGSEDMVHVVARRRHKGARDEDEDVREKKDKEVDRKEKGEKSSKREDDEDDEDDEDKKDVARDVEGRDLDESE